MYGKMTPEIAAYGILRNEPLHKDREALEQTLCSDAECSYKYARYVMNAENCWTHAVRYPNLHPIKRRFVLGEAAISTSDEYSYEYADWVIGGRFELGEAAISENAWYSYWYAKEIIWERFKLGEAAISKEAELSYDYAKDVIRGNWTPELAVMCPCWLYTYAKDVVKGRLPAVMHNKMISFGIIDSSDKYVKKYLGAKKYCTLKGKDIKHDSRNSVFYFRKRS